MKKIVLCSLLAITAAISCLNAHVAAAPKEDTETVIEKLEQTKTVYVPGKNFFVSHSDQRWVGEDNYSGDKDFGCFAPDTVNSHGRFGGVWQSNGFAKYVYNTIFGDIPQYDYHCNPESIKGNVELVGRYASKCSNLKGTTDGQVTVDNIELLLSKTKVGDILVVASKGLCKLSGTSMIIAEINNAGIVVYQADYTGQCAVTENAISYDALAKYHLVALLHSTNYPLWPEEPPKPAHNLSISGDDFALNQNISASWNKTKWTDEYEVALVDAQTLQEVESITTTSLVASFTFSQPGKYKISDKGKNEYGTGQVSLSDEIVVHNVNIVTFVDHDGTVLSTQRVMYGADAYAPSSPERRGYKFDGWDKSLLNITKPATITAKYEILKYVVRFYDTDGKTIIKTERVPFEQSATPPDNYSIDTGYIFAGWHVEFDENHRCADYTKVDGDMKLIATQCWKNKDLPITIDFKKATLLQDGKTYRIEATVVNNPDEATSFKLIATLKTANGKTVKSVPYKEMTLAQGASVDISEDIIYTEKITSIELLAVGVKDNVKTGGAYSEVAASEITALTSWHWGSWGEWTTENKISEYDDYEQAIQYSYRDKEFFTHSDSSKVSSDWTLYYTEPHVSGWSSWSTSNPGAVNTPALKREIKTQTVPAVVGYEYRYGRWKYGTRLHFCPTLAKSQYGGTWNKDYTAWSTSRRSITASNKWLCSYNHSNHIGQTATNRWSEYGSGYYWEESRQYTISPAYTQYSYRNTTYTYYYYRFKAWNQWQFNAVSPTSDREVQTRVVYRYRNKVEDVLSDPDAGNENDGGTQYEFSGVVPNVTDDISGKLANLFVYKKTNSDPTEAQLEYVGQTRIGEGNTYDISFIPREEPSEDTGDFIVALGVEGSDSLANIEVIKAALPVFKVKFLNENGEEISIVEVEQGGAAPAPEAPEKQGHTFVKWSDNVTNVQSDIETFAVYEKNLYTITFVDLETATVTSNLQRYGDPIIYPELAPLDHILNRQWENSDTVTMVEDNLVIKSVCKYEQYEVKFVKNTDDETVVISEQTVEYGMPAILPEEIPAEDGMVFCGWAGACSYDYITCDVEFSPVYLYQQTAETPTAHVTQLSDGKKEVTLSCDTENANIYYYVEKADCAHAELFAVNESVEDNVARLYAESVDVTIDEAYGTAGSVDGYSYLAHFNTYMGEPIILNEGDTVVYLSSAQNMNDSVPESQSAEPETYFNDAQISKNSFRQYRNTVEGDIEMTFSNISPLYDECVFSLCFYDEKGVMIDVIPKAVDVTPGTNVVKFDSVVVNTTAQSVKAKLISWLTGGSVKPIINVFEFDIN